MSAILRLPRLNGSNVRPIEQELEKIKNTLIESKRLRESAEPNSGSLREMVEYEEAVNLYRQKFKEVTEYKKTLSRFGLGGKRKTYRKAKGRAKKTRKQKH